MAAAVIAGYLLAVAVSSCFSFALPMGPADSTLSGLLISFIIYAGAILWAFAVHSLWRLWWGLGGMTLAFSALSILLAPVAVR